jgi:hypothetical protein
VRRVVCRAIASNTVVSQANTVNRYRQTVLSRLHRIHIHIHIRADPILNLTPPLLPRRNVQLAAPHGLHREPQLGDEFQTYVPIIYYHVASCRNPISFCCFRVRAWGRPHSPGLALGRPTLFIVTVWIVSLRKFTDMLTACSTCSGGPAKRRCSRCKAAYYCDRNCQRSDWKTHRSVCEPAMQTYSAPATPNFSTPASPTNES